MIIGYTEIGLLIDQGHTQLPVLDTTALFMRKSLLILRYVLRSKNIIREYHKHSKLHNF